MWRGLLQRRRYLLGVAGVLAVSTVTAAQGAAVPPLPILSPPPPATPAGRWAASFADSPSGIVAIDDIAVDGVGDLAFAGTKVADVNVPSDTGFIGVRNASTGAPVWAVDVPTFTPGGLAFELGDQLVVGGVIQRSVTIDGRQLTTPGQAAVLLAFEGKTGKLVWSNVLAGPYIGAVAVDAAGEIYATGYWFGRADFGGTTLTEAVRNSTLFVAKYLPGGRLVWVKSFGNDDGAGAVGRSIATTPDGHVIVAGGFTPDAPLRFGALAPLTTDPRVKSTAGYIASLSADGSPVWARAFGNTGEGPGIGSARVAVDKAGDVVVVGSTTGSTNDFGGGVIPNPTGVGPFDGYAAKYAGADGAYRWSEGFFGINPQGGGLGGVTVDSSNDPVVGGGFSGPLAIVHPDGTSTEIAAVDRALFARLDPMTGNPQLAIKSGENAGAAGIEAVAVDGNGHAYTGGEIDSGTLFGWPVGGSRSTGFVTG